MKWHNEEKKTKKTHNQLNAEKQKCLVYKHSQWPISTQHRRSADLHVISCVLIMHFDAEVMKFEANTIRFHFYVRFFGFVSLVLTHDNIITAIKKENMPVRNVQWLHLVSLKRGLLFCVRFSLSFSPSECVCLCLCVCVSVYTLHMNEWTNERVWHVYASI